VGDATEPASLSTLQEIRNDAPELQELPAVCFINKSDLKDDIVWTDASTEQVAQMTPHSYWTSAKTGDNVEDAFLALSELLL